MSEKTFNKIMSGLKDAEEYMMTDREQELTELLKTLNGHKEIMFKQREDWDNRYSVLYKKIEDAQNELHSIKLEKCEADWYFLLEVKPESMVRYKAADNALRKIGLYASGYWEETNQRCIQISLYRDDKEHANKVMESVQVLLPYLKARSGGFKQFSITDESLSEHGSYSLQVWPDRYEVEKMYYYNSKTVYSSPNIEDVFDYIRKELYYNQGLAPKTRFPNAE
jgi:hypothetical protein